MEPKRPVSLDLDRGTPRDSKHGWMSDLLLITGICILAYLFVVGCFATFPSGDDLAVEYRPKGYELITTNVVGKLALNEDVNSLSDYEILEIIDTEISISAPSVYKNRYKNVIMTYTIEERKSMLEDVKESFNIN